VALDVSIEKMRWKTDVQVLRLRGRLDTHTVDILEAVVEKNVSLPPHRWALDLGKLDYVSSAGISALVGILYKLQPQEGSLCFFGAQEKVARIFALLGLNASLKFFESESAARANY
jgi:anti-anti-sigma factor